MKPTYDKLRGYRAAAVKPPADDSKDEKKKAKVGQQSFADIEGLFAKLIKALEKVPGYAPPADELTLPELGALAADFGDKNEMLASLGPSLGVLVRERQALYESLSDKAQSIKAAVSAQYGPTTPEYGAIKGLKF